MPNETIFESDPMLGQVEQLAAANSAPANGINKKIPRCVTPTCPSKGKCRSPETEGSPRDYSINLGGKSFCGYYRVKNGVWQSKEK